MGPLLFVSVYWSLSCIQLFVTSWTMPTRLLCPCDSPGKNTGVGSQSLLQGIFLTHGYNPGLLSFRQILYHLRHQGYYVINICVIMYIIRYLYINFL